MVEVNGWCLPLHIKGKAKIMKFTKQERNVNGKYKKSNRDVFLLWGEYPKGWAMVKDLLLCVFLLNALIGQFEKVDIASLMQSETHIFVQSRVVEVAEAKSIQEEVKTPESSKMDVSSVVAKVYRLESSGGKNDSCRERGLYNGFGFGWYDGKKPCYSSHEEVKSKVLAWFEDKLKEHSLEEALCGYNLGFGSENMGKCLSKSAEYPYLRNFETL